MKPDELARELLKTLGDADHNTAQTALDIAKLLVGHRELDAHIYVSETGANDQSC